jgi:hypothetical protein
MAQLQGKSTKSSFPGFRLLVARVHLQQIADIVTSPDSISLIAGYHS